MKLCRNCLFRRGAAQWKRILWRGMEEGQKVNLSKRRYPCILKEKKIKLEESCESWKPIPEKGTQLEFPLSDDLEERIQIELSETN